jgi:hypothetical protein
MPRTLWKAQYRDELISRINSLEPEAKPLWGKMSAPQMLAHLTDWMSMAKGQLPTKGRRLFLRYPVIKHLAIYWLPFPKGLPTAKELITRTPAEWSTERAAVCEGIESFERLHPDGVWPLHPAFETLTPAAWGVLGYRHTDHHLRQFGV